MVLPKQGFNSGISEHQNSREDVEHGKNQENYYERSPNHYQRALMISAYHLVRDNFFWTF